MTIITTATQSSAKRYESPMEVFLAGERLKKAGEITGWRLSALLHSKKVTMKVRLDMTDEQAFENGGTKWVWLANECQYPIGAQVSYEDMDLAHVRGYSPDGKTAYLSAAPTGTKRIGAFADMLRDPKTGGGEK